MSDQTPRVPELWWSTPCVYADREGAAFRYILMRDTRHFDLPADAVRLVPEAERDLALWLHAEAQWSRDLARELLADVSQRFDAERDQLQARIDAALAVLDEPVPTTPHGADALWTVQNHRAVQVQRVRAALQGDQ